MKYKNVEQTAESEPMVTSGPVFTERFPKQEDARSNKKESYSPEDSPNYDAKVTKVTKSPDKSDEKMIVIREKDGSISFSIDDEWAAYEVIGALEMVKGTVLNRVNPQAPSIMDRILMKSGIK